MMTQEPVLRTVDDCTGVLKPSVQRLHLLSKVPSGLSQMAVNYTNCGNEKYKKKARAWLNDVYAEVNKRGPPQPKDGSFHATEMIIGFASWHYYTDYSNIFGKEDLYWAVKCQGDPGKLLYAYTVGCQLDLQPGQILVPIDRVQHVLLTWLHGLNGMTFKLMRDDELDEKHPKFKETNRWVFEWNTVSVNVAAVRDEARVLKRQESIAQEQIARQNAPAPPPYSEQGPGKLGAKIGYKAQTSDEISLKKGDVLEVLEDQEPTEWRPWISVRKGDEKGSVRRAHVIDAVRLAEAQADYSAKEINELSFNMGEMIEILHDQPPQPLLQARKGNQTGYALRRHFERPIRKLEAKFDYSAQKPDELSSKKGDTLEVVREDSEFEWTTWISVRAGGKEGSVPRLYVENALKTVEAQIDYAPTDSDKLSFLKGDHLEILVEFKSTN